MTSANKKNVLLRINLAAFIVGGLATIWALVRNRIGGETASFLSALSPALLFVILAIGLTLGIAVYLFCISFRGRFWSGFLGRSIENLFAKNIAVLLLFSLFLLSYVSIFTSDQTLGSLASFREWLSPILVWIFVLSFQLLFTRISLKKFDGSALKHSRNVLVLASILFGLSLVFVAFIALTKIGIEPDKVLW